MQASRKPRVSKERALTSAPHEHNGLPGRVLAIDYGRRRIGLAISDELRITARPAGVLRRKNRQETFHGIREFARQHGARCIIVGYPLNLDGAAGEMAEEAARFASRLRKELGVEVELVDERLTSWAADQMRVHSPSASERLENDDLAAAILLRDYLERASLKRPASRRHED